MTKKKPNQSFTKNQNTGGAMIKPFITGARVQLERYLEAQRLVSAHKVNGAWIDRCLYELSSLLEHLSTVSIYLKLCGVELPIQQTIIDIRNHLRHDVREEFDEDKKTKQERAKRLGINPKLQMELVYIDSGVKVGTTELKANQISLFLDMAEMTAYAMLMGMDIEVEGGNINVRPPKPKSEN